MRVRLAEDSVVEIGWDVGRPLSEAVQRYGGVIVTTLTEDAPTVCVGEATPDVRGRPLLRATFDGWSAGVAEGAQSVLAERNWFVPAGVAAGALVSSAWTAAAANRPSAQIKAPAAADRESPSGDQNLTGSDPTLWVRKTSASLPAASG